MYMIAGCLDVMNQHYCSQLHELHWAQSPHLMVRSVTCPRKFNTLFVLFQSSENPALFPPPDIDEGTGLSNFARVVQLLSNSQHSNEAT